jgi:CAAX protease family protein
MSELIAYRSALPPRQAIVLIPLLFVWSVAAYTALAPAAELLRKFLFGWWPDWLRLDGLAGDLATTDRTVLWTIVVLSIVLNVVVPWVEELYFRGYLLPRMGRGGRWAPVLSAALFSLYHVWLPWEFFSRFAALLPAIYMVWWKRDLRVSIWVHVLLNSVGSVGLLVLALGNSTKI